MKTKDFVVCFNNFLNVFDYEPFLSNKQQDLWRVWQTGNLFETFTCNHQLKVYLVNWQRYISLVVKVKLIQPTKDGVNVTTSLLTRLLNGNKFKR